MKYFRYTGLLILSICFFNVGTVAYAASKPKVLYLKAYNLFEKAKEAVADNKKQQAKKNYFFALNILEGLKEEHSSWHEKEVTWLLNEVQKQIMLINSGKAIESVNADSLKELEAEIVRLKKEKTILQDQHNSLQVKEEQQQRKIKDLSDTVISLGEKERDLVSALEEKETLIKKYQDDDLLKQNDTQAHESKLQLLYVEIEELKAAREKVTKELADKSDAFEVLEKEFATYKESTSDDTSSMSSRIAEMEKDYALQKEGLINERDMLAKKYEEQKKSFQEKDVALNKAISELEVLAQEVKSKEKEISGVRQQYQVEINKIKAEHQREILESKKAYETQIKISGSEESEKIKLLREEIKKHLAALDQKDALYKANIANIKDANEKSLAEKEKDINSLKEQISEKEQEIHVYELNVNELNKHVAKLGDQNLMLEDKLLIINQEKESLIKENDNYRKNLKLKDETLSQKNTDSLQVSKEYELLKGSVEELNRQVSSLSAENKIYKDKEQQLAQNNAALEAELKNAKERFAGQEQEKNQFNNEKMELETKNKILTDSVESLSKENIKLQKEFDLLGAEKNKGEESFNKQVADLKNIVEAKDKQIQKISLELETFGSKEGEVNKSLEAKNKKISLLEKEIMTLMSRITPVEHEIKKAYQAQEKLEQELKLAQKEVIIKDKEIEGLNEVVAMAKHRESDALKALELKKSEMDLLGKDKNSLLKDIVQREEDIKAEQNTVADLNSKVLELSNGLTLKEKTIEELQQKLSSASSKEADMLRIMSDKKVEFDALEKDNIELAKKLADNEQKLKTLNVENEQATINAGKNSEDIKNLKVEVAKKEFLIQELKNKLDESQNNNETISLEAKDGIATIKLLEKEKNTLAGKVMDMEKSLQQSKETVLVLQKENENLVADNKRLTEENKVGMSKESEDQKDSFEDIRKQHAKQIKLLNANYIKNKNDINKKLDQAEAKILDLQQTNEMLEEENKKLEIKLSLKQAENS